MRIISSSLLSLQLLSIFRYHFAGKSRKFSPKLSMTSKIHSNDFLWSFCTHDADTSEPLSRKYSMILLNSPAAEVSLVHKLWKSCKYIVCADGGANRLYYGTNIDKRSQFIPSFVIGDLDSAEAEVLDAYR